jgi:hypothetical protein
VWDERYCRLLRTWQGSGELENVTVAFMPPLEDKAEMQWQGMSDQIRHQAGLFGYSNSLLCHA